MPTSVVLGTGRALPERIVTNDELAALMDTSDEWIRERTGIRERRWVRPGEKGVDLAYQAATAALEMAGLAASDLDAIVYASLTPDHFLPANGTVLQHALGARQIPALNINNGCSGFVYALSVADSYIRVGLARRSAGGGPGDPVHAARREHAGPGGERHLRRRGRCAGAVSILCYRLSLMRFNE